MTKNFVGRADDLAKIKEQLRPGEVSDRQKISVVHGLGGMGKTQVAIEYARLHKSSYTSFFWLNGKTEVTLIDSLLQIAPRLTGGRTIDVEAQKKGIEESRKAAQDVLDWFTLEGNTQWLLVYDNIDKTSYEEGELPGVDTSSFDITDYIPGGDSGSVIITTRLQRLVSLGSSVHLRPLVALDSLLILQKYIGRNLKRNGSQVALGDGSDFEEWDQGWFELSTNVP
jgi:hypothetical protein